MQPKPAGYDEYLRLSQLSFASARLQSLPNVEACKEFFDTCAELKRHPHPLRELDRDDYPVYYLPSDHPSIKWDTLTTQQRERICSFNFFDFGSCVRINQMSPLDLITPCNKLDKLERAEAEQGQLSATQQVQKAAYKVRKLWATVETGQSEVTASDWALLNASHLVRPMYSGNNMLFWPDGGRIWNSRGGGGDR